MVYEVRTAEQLFQISHAVSDLNIHIGSRIVPAKFRWNNKCKYLLISFHGAVNRQTRTPPIFPPFLPKMGDAVAQLCLSDPLMLDEGKYSMTWYAGSENFPAQILLSDFFNAVTEFGKFERVVFFGSSAGGFASLFYSSALFGSVAVVGCPQTNMYTYYPGHLKRYLEGCWPSLKNVEGLSKNICMDLCEHYSIKKPNTVIYLQSAGDHFHTRTQLAPFLAAVSRAPGARFIIRSDFWGRLGHGASVPIAALQPWVRAALISSSIEVDDLLQSYHNLDSTVKISNSHDATKGKLMDMSGEILLAELLRNYHLR